MPQAATLPTHAHTPRRTREAHARTRSLEERVAVLETHSQAIATKADISDLRSEILKWGTGAAIALFAAFAALFVANTARIDRLDGKIDASVAKLDAKLEQSVAKLDARMDRLDTKLDAILAELRSQRRGE